MIARSLRAGALAALLPFAVGGAQGARLLRQPSLGPTQVAFTYGADIWVSSRNGGEATRLTSTPAVEADPHFSPDGKWIAFTSNRSGVNAVYVMPVEGGNPRRLTWHNAGDMARGWSPDGKSVLFASMRNTAPSSHAHLYTIAVNGGVAARVPEYMGMRGSFSPDGKRIVVDRVSRWHQEYRSYRGGQNTPLTILNLADLSEVRIPNERQMDIQPVWMGDAIYFISDRDWASNVWSYDVKSGALKQLTHYKSAEVKWLDGRDGTLVFEQDGYLHEMNVSGAEPKQLAISVHGDFPWAEARWADVSRTITAAELGPQGKRVVFQSRGEIFTVPVEKGDARNLTHSSGAADRAPTWAPDGKHLAWFSDEGAGYRLVIGDADGLTSPRVISIEDAKMAWSPAWSPDGTRIAFVDERTRLRVVEVASGKMIQADIGGTLNDRGSMEPVWSPDSKWLAYAKSAPNQFHQVKVWSVADGKVRAITDELADAAQPVWDRNGKWLYFLASTDVGLKSGWADLGSITRTSTEGVYIALLRNDEQTPFTIESDEEGAKAAAAAGAGPGAPPRDTSAKRPVSDSAVAKNTTPAMTVRIDFDRFDRRILPLPIPVRDYGALFAGPAGTLFVGENAPGQPGMTLHKWDTTKRKSDVFVTGVSQVSTSADGKKLLYQANNQWAVVGADAPPKAGDGRLAVTLRTQVDPATEWKQIFEEAWRIERDFFYAPNHHGNDWDAVHARYAPLVPYVRHRDDLSYILTLVGGELSVGHSFVRGGDLPAVDSSRIGLLGADVVADAGRWKISRIFTSESWNPGLGAPLDAPGIKASVGNYIIAVNGENVTTDEELGAAMDGTVDKQTVLRLSSVASGEGAWNVTVVPIRTDLTLRTRAFIEDNRRRVDSLSGGKLAYAWIPNTASITNFDRYYFAQQDKQGAVIDERFNSGGNLDDYMVGIMQRKIVGGVTNDIPGGTPWHVPMAGIFGPKVLLTNEQAGSGGDFFPWVFHTLGIGPEVGTRTWGGLVASCVPYPLVDGGTITSPCSAVFDANGGYPAEGVGVQPDIEVLQDAKSIAAGRDPQLERGVQEALKLLVTQGVTLPKAPPFPVKSRRPPL
ncbi:MAG: peptidase [Gemmatimonadetes bacterium]|nr:peptidase [Gemmatimonadota bacterium]